MSHNLYTVYDNKTDMPVAIDETAKKCAELMGITYSSFYSTVNRCEQGANQRWDIWKKTKLADLDLDIVEGISFDDLPPMLTISQLSDVLQLSGYQVCKLCKEYNIPIIAPGKGKTKFISRNKFFKKIRGLYNGRN